MHEFRAGQRSRKTRVLHGNKNLLHSATSQLVQQLFASLSIRTG